MSDYEVFMEMSEEDVFLACMDLLGVKLFKFERSLDEEINDRSWAKKKSK